MLKKKIYTILFFLMVLICLLLAFTHSKNAGEEILSYKVDLKSQDLKFYWKNDEGRLLGSLQDLKTFVENKNLKLLFATNGGMYQEDQSPLGLFVQEQKIIHPLNVKGGKGNFHLVPNGVFYITTDKTAGICKTGDIKTKNNIDYATQSGPMLVIDGEIHPAFTKGSKNLNIRNGVGILPDNKIIFAMSKKEINFYDFALYFKEQGCKNALYLDGFVSRTYLPEKNWIQTDGTFGVMIGVTEQKK